MAISKLHIENFRGIEENTEIDVKPITIFVGPNSSGKSSCIHALACLSQTIKITADNRPLVLDDEFADVHLGRFIEVIHSKSYQDQIGLGISLDNITIMDVELGENEEGNPQVKRESKEGDIKSFYKFKCSKRTQEISLESFEVDFNGPLFSGKRSKESYTITTKNQKTQIPIGHALGNSFLLDETSLFINAAESGMHPFEYVATQSSQSEILSALSKTLYLGPFRQPPARRYASRGASPSEVGPMGEATITMLANESIQSNSRPHLTQIAKWLVHMKLAKGIDVNRIGSSDLFNVNLTLSDGEKFPLADLGYGLSQVLPVLTQCSFSPVNSTLLFEQPELHVHPLACKGLAKVFVDTVKSKDAKICLETHSPDLIRAFFQEVSKGNLSKDDLQIYSVRRVRQKTKLEKIEVDEYGDNYENWEKDLSF